MPELVPVTLVLSMDEKGSKQVDVLDVQPAAAAREQIAAAVCEWQLGLHNTMLVGFLPPIKISVEVPLCVVEHQAFPARVVWVSRKGCRKVSQSVARSGKLLRLRCMGVPPGRGIVVAIMMVVCVPIIMTIVMSMIVAMTV
jgi:hypothetical protein